MSPARLEETQLAKLLPEFIFVEITKLTLTLFA